MSVPRPKFVKPDPGSHVYCWYSKLLARRTWARVPRILDSKVAQVTRPMSHMHQQRRLEKFRYVSFSRRRCRSCRLDSWTPCQPKYAVVPIFTGPKLWTRFVLACSSDMITLLIVYSALLTFGLNLLCILPTFILG